MAATDEAGNLTKQWEAMWAYKGLRSRLVYWSVNPTKKAGVGILLNLLCAQRAEIWNPELWNFRTIGLEIEDCLVMNIYAPADNVMLREELFSELKAWRQESKYQSLIGGDFNCVEKPTFDRLGGQRGVMPESRALTQLMVERERCMMPR